MATNSGLTSVNCDKLSVDYTITLQDSNGTAGQVITSNGDDESVYWGTNSASTTHPLTAGANVSYASGNASLMVFNKDGDARMSLKCAADANADSYVNYINYIETFIKSFNIN